MLPWHPYKSYCIWFVLYCTVYCINAKGAEYKNISSLPVHDAYGISLSIVTDRYLNKRMDVQTYCENRLRLPDISFWGYFQGVFRYFFCINYNFRCEQDSRSTQLLHIMFTIKTMANHKEQAALSSQLSGLSRPQGAVNVCRIVIIVCSSEVLISCFFGKHFVRYSNRRCSVCKSDHRLLECSLRLCTVCLSSGHKDMRPGRCAACSGVSNHTLHFLKKTAANEQSPKWFLLIPCLLYTSRCV